MDDLFSIIEELHIDHIFAYSDEQVYFRRAHTLGRTTSAYYNINERIAQTTGKTENNI